MRMLGNLFQTILQMQHTVLNLHQQLTGRQADKLLLKGVIGLFKLAINLGKAFQPAIFGTVGIELAQIIQQVVLRMEYKFLYSPQQLILEGLVLPRPHQREKEVLVGAEP